MRGNTLPLNTLIRRSKSHCSGLGLESPSYGKRKRANRQGCSKIQSLTRRNPWNHKPTLICVHQWCRKLPANPFTAPTFSNPFAFPFASSRLRVRPTVCKAPPLQCLGAAGAVACRTYLGLASPSYGKHKLRSVLLRFRQHKAHIPPLAPVKRGRGVGGEGEHSPCKHTNQAFKIALQRARAGKPELRETQTGEPAGFFQHAFFHVEACGDVAQPSSQAFGSSVFCPASGAGASALGASASGAAAACVVPAPMAAFNVSS